MFSQLRKYVVVINGVLLVACWRFEMVRISDNWFRLEIKLNAFRWSTISQKQFINSSSPSICDPAGIYLLKVNNKDNRTTPMEMPAGKLWSPSTNSFFSSNRNESNVFHLKLQSRTKYLEANKEIRKNWLRLEKFDIYFPWFLTALIKI